MEYKAKITETEFTTVSHNRQIEWMKERANTCTMHIHSQMDKIIIHSIKSYFKIVPFHEKNKQKYFFFGSEREE